MARRMPHTAAISYNSTSILICDRQPSRDHTAIGCCDIHRRPHLCDVPGLYGPIKEGVPGARGPAVKEVVEEHGRHALVYAALDRNHLLGRRPRIHDLYRGARG